MTLVIPPGYAECAIELVGDGDPDPWYCTFGVATDLNEDTIDVLGAHVLSCWANLLQHLPPQVHMTGVKLTIGQDGEPIRQFVGRVGGPQAGSSNVAKLPQNCAVLIRKNTGLGGRRNRGRMFVPNMATEGTVDNVGRIQGDVVVAYQDAADDFLTGLGAGGGTPESPMVVLHDSLGSQPVPDPTPVTSLTVDSTISTQRKRLR